MNHFIQHAHMERPEGEDNLVCCSPYEALSIILIDASACPHRHGGGFPFLPATTNKHDTTTMSCVGTLGKDHDKVGRYLRVS